ncbi:hypothetical protein Tco_0242907 [Tanacetum coccineum]
MNSPPNHEWEEGLDIDDSNLLLTPFVHPTNNLLVHEIYHHHPNLISAKNLKLYLWMECEQALVIDDSDLRLTLVVHPSNNPHIVPEIITTTQTLFSSQSNQVDNYVVKPIRITRKVIEDDDFTRAPWHNAIDYVNVDGGMVMDCFGDVKKFLKNGKLEKVVAVIKSCTLNALGDLIVTLKDLSGTIFGTIHYKVLTEERFAKAITIGAALILHNVSIFSPKQSTQSIP